MACGWSSNATGTRSAAGLRRHADGAPTSSSVKPGRNSGPHSPPCAHIQSPERTPDVFRRTPSAQARRPRSALAGGHLSWHVVNSADADIPEQFRIRRDKRARLLAEGRDPYPVAIARTHTLAEVRAAHPDLPIDTATDDVVGVAGRVMYARNSGKLCFATLQDGDGTSLQVMISLDKVGQEALDDWKADVDLGDIVYVHGNVISSRRGELSVLADRWQMAAKSLRPLPVAHKEMSEESRVRQRYVDLIVRPQARAVARQRIAVVRAIRSALERRGFLEVETPMLQTLAGGAAGRAVITTL